MRVEQRVQSKQQRLGVGRRARCERQSGRILQHDDEARILIAHVTFDGGDRALHQRLRFVEPPSGAQHDREIHAFTGDRHGILTCNGHAEGTRPLRMQQRIIGSTSPETGLRQIPEYQCQRVMRTDIGRTARQHVG